MDATITLISDAVAGERSVVAPSDDATGGGTLIEITRFDSFSAQASAGTAYCILTMGGARAA